MVIRKRFYSPFAPKMKSSKTYLNSETPSLNDMCESNKLTLNSILYDTHHSIRAHAHLVMHLMASMIITIHNGNF